MIDNCIKLRMLPFKSKYLSNGRGANLKQEDVLYMLDETCPINSFIHKDTLQRGGIKIDRHNNT